MENKLAEKVGLLAHLYEFLHGGRFSSHHQLRFYSQIFFNLALQVLNGNGYEDVKYRFKLKDILIEGQ